MAKLRDNLFFEFSAISFVVLAAIALSLPYVLSSKVREDAIKDLVDEAIGSSSGRLLRALTPSDFKEPMIGERYDAFHEFVRRSVVSQRTARVKLWSPDGTVIYSDDPQRVGERFPAKESLLRALRGETSLAIKVPEDAENPRERYLGTLMEVYTPVIFPGSTEPQGVFEIYQYYEPTAQRITGMRRWIFGTVGLGFLIVYGSLVSIVWRGWSTISRQRRQLETVNTRLEARVAERTAELTSMNQEVVRSNRDLEQFAYVASHDLQEPLRAVVGFTKILARRYEGKLDGDTDDLTARAVNAATRMQLIISDLLEYSRVGRDLGELQPADCDVIVDQEVDGLSAVVAGSGALVTHDPLPTIMANAPLLSEVFRNLIGNTIKYRGERSPRVNISAERRDDHWVLSVQDNGIGIDPQYAEQIFVIFKRLHSRTEYAGTGIGLAICKKAAERLGGNIWVESRLGEGATFYLSIPITEISETVLSPGAGVAEHSPVGGS